MRAIDAAIFILIYQFNLYKIFKGGNALKKEYKTIQEFIDDVHNELHVDEVLIDMGIVLKNEFKGQFIKCKFHDEKSPSLQITEDFWKCYGGCGLKGDLFKFLEYYYNTDFIDATKKLADHLNVKILDVKYKFDDKYSKLKEEWNKYLYDMDKASKGIKEFKRDYFPQEIGYDKRMNYLVLPLTSKTGAILGFTKRRIGDEEFKIVNGEEYKTPKWQHSSLKDSMIAHCHNAFNLYTASPEIRKKKSVIAGEGPKDVIAYQRASFNNTICTCGTSNSSNVWDLIFPVKEIVLSYDLDKAGIKATISTLIYLAPIFNVKNIKSVILPDGKDPYDVVTMPDGVNMLKNFYENRIPAVEFLIQHGDIDAVKELYDAVPEYNKMYVMKMICNMKGFSISESESWLESSNEKGKANKDLQLDEKETLLAIVNCKDINDKELMNISNPAESVNKAKRILLLKYGIKIE